MGVGAVYALLAQGLVVVYRGCGVVNFAHGALAMLGAFTYDELVRGQGWAQAPAVVTAVASVAALGALIHLAVMRPLRTASPLARVIATLGIMIIIQSAATLVWGASPRTVRGFLPRSPLRLGSLTVASDRLWLLGIAVVLTAVLTLVFRRTQLGLATRALAENQTALASLGWSPDLIAVLNWALGGGLAALAGILIVPLTGLQIGTLTSLVIVAMAVALFGSFSSFWLVTAGGLGLGIIQSELNRYVTQQGVSQAVPFLLILAVMVARGRGLPLRGSLVEHRPTVGTGKVRWRVVLPLAAALAALALWVLPAAWNAVMTYSCVIAILLLSVVVLTGYCGQLSLAQFTFAGIGAYFSGRLVAAAHWPFELALLAGIAGAAAVGTLFALPALRTRGVNLAVITLGLGSAVQAVLFNNASFTGGAAGTTVGPPTFLGIGVDAIASPGRYAVFTLCWLLLATAVVAGVRRGPSGRRMLAVRTNERAAASLGIDLVRTKLSAFALSAALAGLGGTLLAFTASTITYDVTFDPTNSITTVTLAVLGGVGYLTGPLLGSTLSTGGVGSLLTNYLGAIEAWLTLAGGLIFILLLLQDANGMASHNQHAVARLAAKARRRPPAGDARADAAQAADEPAPGAPRQPDTPAADDEPAGADLVVEGLTVRYGAVVAVDTLDLVVRPGEVLGLIGPNGAGKTSVIDAVSGFTGAVAGSVRIGHTPLENLPAHRRARAGLTRTFQSLELFGDLTVRENLLAADGGQGRLAGLRDLVRPAHQRVPAPAMAALREFGLLEHLDEVADRLSFGQRRLVAIARALATGPAVLLLDEPAAGLDDTASAHLGRLVRQLADNWRLAVLLVEHDMAVVMSICDRVTVVDFGRRIAHGTPAQVSQDPAVRAAYLGEPEPVTVPDEANPPGPGVPADPNVAPSRA
ncbi:hypothetical protein BCD48_25100 [Pseudofrankia sp. BMG5.36]|nr:hypothetical protein BCD48_25100 [Pseudofrankia sp. BMG5.36]